MSTPRKTPHKSCGIEGLKIELDFLYEDYEYVKNQENSGDTIANYFESLTSKIFELAIGRYYLEGICTDDFMEMLKKSSLAACNYFKLITNKGKEIQYNWEGGCYSAIYKDERIHHTADSILNCGLKAAIITNQNQEIEYLSNIDLSNIVVKNMLTGGAYSLRTLALQLLCSRNIKQGTECFDTIEKLPPPSRNLDAKLIDSECKILLALEKKHFDKLPKLIDDNLIIHKKMYDNDSRNLRYNYFGLISIHNLASLILARKKQMILGIKNQYIPSDLFEASIKNI
ncbi:hypothetical protein [Flavivirga sp. 57AJ16]|uniref:hypothetical protein n=1 Tax=Flavivirga sp. 57AJ16 TaxID=3025307 RepID=UPI0023673AB2|nr:hypothetical protein [Flavivirga sp. 57AJ16]MDD7887342.1 hypothetical protein [Flavivirga sp. 57AJ16]